MNFADSLREMDPERQLDDKQKIWNIFADCVVDVVKKRAEAAAKGGGKSISGCLAYESYDGGYFLRDLSRYSPDDLAHTTDRFLILNKVNRSELPFHIGFTESTKWSYKSPLIFTRLTENYLNSYGKGPNYIDITPSEIDDICYLAEKRISSLGFDHYSVKPRKQQLYHSEQRKKFFSYEHKMIYTPTNLYATVLEIEASW